MSKSLTELVRSSSLMRWTLKRRRIVFIAIFICICFLIYQLLSLKELNVQMSDQLSHTRDRQEFGDKHTISESDGQELRQIEPNLIHRKSDINTKSVDKSVKNIVLFGILPKYVGLYRRTSDFFRCITSGEEIPYDQINDDYCDCEDGSDEPSTNACPQNRFYCRTNTGMIDDFISSAKVNDGICDCCDGSDEYKGLSSPLRLTRSQIDTIKSSRRLVPTTPCPNSCPV